MKIELAECEVATVMLVSAMVCVLCGGRQRAKWLENWCLNTDQYDTCVL